MRIILLAATATLFAAPAHADCLGDIKDILARSMTSGPYVMEMTAGDMTMTAEVVPPSAMHSTATLPQMTQEMTVVDGKAWMKAEGTWTALPDAVAEQVAAGLKGAAGMLEQIAAPECLGTQNLDGKDYLAFKYNFAATGVETTSTLYVDPASNLPAVVVGTSTAAGKTTGTRATYRYDPAVTVTAPQ